MKLLTKNEILFLLDSDWTPTVYQCDEWYKIGIDAENFLQELKEYNIDADLFLDKFFGEDEIDSISFEDEAAYILSIYFEWDDLSQLMRDNGVLQWLRNWKYYYGARKWSEQDAINAAEVALDILRGYKKVVADRNKHIMILDRED